MIIEGESISLFTLSKNKEMRWWIKKDHDTVVDSHEKTVVYRVLPLGSKQLLRQYGNFDSSYFIEYNEAIKKKLNNL